jgi:ribosomal-protein-serine acetyltransferase
MAPLPEGAVGDGVTLRRWAPADAPALHAAVVASTEHLRPWMPWIAEEPKTLEQRRELIATWDREWAAGGDCPTGIWVDGELVGACGLHRRIGAGGLEIGYWVHVDHVGRGIATRAAEAAVAMAFSVPDIEVVEIHQDTANPTSGRVPEKLGFTCFGDFDAKALSPGEAGVERRWQLTREAWEARTS